MKKLLVVIVGVFLLATLVSFFVSDLVRWIEQATKPEPRLRSAVHVSDCVFWNSDGVDVETSRHHAILIGEGAIADRDYQLVITFDDGTELRVDLPTNRWIRGVRSNRPPPLGNSWRPVIGDRVSSTYYPDNFYGPTFITTITKVEWVGVGSQSGWLIYGEGLPGIDSSWVKPLPLADRDQRLP